MWLIDTHTLQFKEFHDCPAKAYAILSHTWRAAGEEVTFDEFKDGKGRDKPGFEKIRLCCEQAKNDGLQYAWIDTCCIDKRNSTELSEAINSMFRWYQQSKICYAYLADISYNNPLKPITSTTSAEVLQTSRWFDRGWTLQELIAPDVLTFYSTEWNEIGTKSGLADDLHVITKIDVDVLKLQKHFLDCSVAQRMSWASERHTTRIEDIAYCLIGLFDVNIPMMYGEGDKAFFRLQQAIIAQSNDQTIFAWFDVPEDGSGLLAPSPANFAKSANVRQGGGKRDRPHYADTNRGLQIDCELLPYEMNTYKMALQCHLLLDESRQAQIAIFLCRTLNDDQYRRVTSQGRSIDTITRGEFTRARNREVFIPHGQRGLKLAPRAGLPLFRIKAKDPMYQLWTFPFWESDRLTYGSITLPKVDTCQFTKGDLERGIFLTFTSNARLIGTRNNCFHFGFDFDFRPKVTVMQAARLSERHMKPLSMSFTGVAIRAKLILALSFFNGEKLAWRKYVIPKRGILLEEEERQSIGLDHEDQMVEIALSGRSQIGSRFENLLLGPIPIHHCLNRCSNLRLSIHPAGGLNWDVHVVKYTWHSHVWVQHRLLCTGCIERIASEVLTNSFKFLFPSLWHAILLPLPLALVFILSIWIEGLFEKSLLFYTFVIIGLPVFLLELTWTCYLMGAEPAAKVDKEPQRTTASGSRSRI